MEKVQNQKQPSFTETPLCYDNGKDAVDHQNASETNQNDSMGGDGDGDGDEFEFEFSGTGVALSKSNKLASASAARFSSWWSVPEIFDSAGDGNLEALKRLLLLTTWSPVTKSSSASSGVSVGASRDNGNGVADHIPSSNNNNNNNNNGSNRPSVSSMHVFLNQLRDKKGSTPLHYAAGNGHLEVCRFLLQIASSTSPTQKRTYSGNATASCASRRTTTTNSHINSNSNKNSNSDAIAITNASSYANVPNRTQGRTALHWAARNGHLSVCKILVEEFGADSDPLARGGVTPLQLAVWRGHVDVCLWLSEKGRTTNTASSNQCNKHKHKHFVVNGWGCTVHHWLAKSPIYSEQRQLQQQQQQQLQQRSNYSIPRAATCDAEDRLLVLCAWLDNYDSEEGSNSSRAWSRPNDHGQTPLHKAGFGGNLPVLKFLIETKGCCDTQRDSQHNTAADCAERNQQWEAAKFLRRHGNPGCLQRARAVLFPERDQSPGALPPPTLSDIRASYLKLTRLYHPDRMSSRCYLGKHYNSCGNQSTTHNSNQTTPVKHFAKESLWKDLQEAYQLWTLWWNNPEEADAMIRGMERHQFLQRELPLLVLWHKPWHENEKKGIYNTGNGTNSNHLCDQSESGMGETAGRINHVGKNESTTTSSSSARPMDKSKKSKKQKISKGNDNRMPPRHQFSLEALQKLEDFERRLARLLRTLPSQEIPLSQLPKEYEKTWGCSSSIINSTSTSGTTAMIRPREYRCKKLGFLLEKHCFRTVEVVQKTKSTGTSETEKAGAAMWVRLKPR
jgi:ankyrin repeat protein